MIKYMVPILLIASHSAFGQVESLEDAEQAGTADLSSFGFGPAFYMISYDDEILEDSTNVTIRGDGSLISSGSSYGTSLGLELHYDWSLWGNRKGYTDADGNTKWTHSNGVVLSPFIGLFDVDNGIKGLAAGLMFGYWRGDENFQNRTSVNIGLGYAIHRDQLVLSKGVSEGNPPPSGFTVEDYTTRDDVGGTILTISVSVDF